MSTIDLTPFLLKDLEKVIFKQSKKDKYLKEREGFRPEKASLAEEEWLYFLHAVREAYLAGADRVCTELNKRSEREVREAQRKAEKQIIRDLGKLL